MVDRAERGRAAQDLAEEFAANGFVRIGRALPSTLCEEVSARAFERLELPDVPCGEWPERTVHLPVVRNWDLREVSPVAWAAAVSLIGDEHLIEFAGVQDNLIVNFPSPTRQWWPAHEWSSDGAGWHKDGDWFRHFLDSPEQALLVIVFWGDVEPRQGPTYVAVDSIAGVARLLADHPEGLDPTQVIDAVPSILSGCDDFRELTGSQGDIVLAHPYLLHTASVNSTDRPRLISNSSVMLRSPIDLSAPARAAAPVARSIITALGVDQIDFEATGPRGRVISDRERRWAAERNDTRIAPEPAGRRPSAQEPA